jgi:hypothetical protein
VILTLAPFPSSIVAPDRSDTNTVFFAIWFPSLSRLTLERVRVYAVVSRDLREAIDLFVARDDAEAMLEEVRENEPALAEALSVEVISLGEESLN